MEEEEEEEKKKKKKENKIQTHKYMCLDFVLES